MTDTETKTCSRCGHEDNGWRRVNASEAHGGALLCLDCERMLTYEAMIATMPLCVVCGEKTNLRRDIGRYAVCWPCARKLDRTAPLKEITAHEWYSKTWNTSYLYYRLVCGHSYRAQSKGAKSMRCTECGKDEFAARQRTRSSE